MSYLAQVTKAVPEAPIITIVGFPGTGKTSLAGLFPSPIFVQAEKASTVFEDLPEDQQPAFLPHLPRADKTRNIKTSDVLRDQLREIATADHPFKTVIVDSVTSLNQMFEQQVVEFDSAGADSIGNAAGGYHKGYDVSSSMHADVVRYCKHIAKRGITVVFLAHTGLVKVKNRPDESSEYSIYSLGMHEKSRKFYVDHSDAVLYLKSQTFVTGGVVNKKEQTVKTARIMDTGERVLITSSDGVVGYVDAKTRYDRMPQEIPVTKGMNPIMQYIPFFNRNTTTATTAEEAQS